MKKLLIVCLLVMAVLVPATPVFADGPDGDKVIFGGSFTLSSGETLDGNLVVFGGNVTLEEDSRVKGDVTLMGGNVDIAGQVDGNLVVFGGNAHLRATAIVDGDVVAIGGNVQRDEGAQVGGEVVEGFESREFPRFEFYSPYRWRVIERYPSDNWFFRSVMNALQTIFFTLVIMALGVLVIIFLPRHTDQVARVVLGSPLPSLGVGFAVLAVTTILAALLFFTCCFAPFGLLLLLALVIAVLFGWTAVGLMVGQRFLKALNARQPVSEVAAVLIGLVLITLLSYVPCLGFLFFVVVASTGLGAVVLTRFGTQEYPLPAPAPSAGEVWLPEELEESETPVPEPKEEGEEAPPEAEVEEESPPEDQGSEMAED